MPRRASVIPQASDRNLDRERDDARWQALMRRALDGDSLAYRELLEDLSGAVTAYVQRMVDQLYGMPDGTRVILYQVPSGSGIRYLNGLMELRGKGMDLDLTREQTVVRMHCKAYELPKKE